MEKHEQKKGEIILTCLYQKFNSMLAANLVQYPGFEFPRYCVHACYGMLVYENGQLYAQSRSVDDRISDVYAYKQKGIMKISETPHSRR